ncbi:hypothetical protein E2562_033813 [Oryza meyeriana var. granulata]|uniref:Chloroplast envelope membrane protein n=1 Tax=Oryza meyeriana var. granulata TaxID=110450 RepID=A0A6G1F146_9ORYZ|nr:hypothetical protein E2562_033813 [Oryza meyeriana var. granulata]
MSLMSCSMVRPSANTVQPVVEERLQRRVYACKVFVVGSQRGRVRNWVVLAKRRSTKRQPWWKSWFSDAWGWPDWSADDVLNAVDGEELPDDEKFKEWKGKAEAIVKLREAQQEAMNSEGRSWEDWIDSGSSTGGSDWGGGTDMLEQITDDPMQIMKKGFVEAFRESTYGDDDDMLFEDRVFEYASTNSAKFLALLILIPWIFDFVVHDYVLMPFLDRYVQKVPLAAELFYVRRSQKLQMVHDLKVEKARFRFEMEIGQSPPLSDKEMWLELREKAVELRDEWRLENWKTFANILSGMVFGIVLFLLICFNESKVALLKFTGYKLLNNISDAGKAFLIIVLADISSGYHSESGWHALVEVVLEHYGLEVDQAAITIFVCVVPVVMDVFVKIWVGFACL